MRADGAANSRIDPPAGARPDLATDEAAASKAVARHNPPWLQKCTDGAGSHVFIFKTDRAGLRMYAGLAQLWVGGTRCGHACRRDRLTTRSSG